MEDSSEVVRESANDNCLVSQSAGWSLCNDRITNRTNSNHVDQSRDNKQDANSQLSALTACETKSADDDKDEEHDH